MSDEARRWDLALTQMAQLGQPPGAPGNVAVMLEQLCKAAVKLLGASGVGVSVMADGGGSGFTAASDLSSRELEELQFTLGEGPCIDAFSGGHPVLVPDLSDGVRRRWPMYVPAALERGVSAIFAFPIQVGGSRLGVLDVSRDSPGSMTSEQVGRAVTFADTALVLILDGQHRAPLGAVPEGFDQAPGFRAEIAQAQGMIMVQLGVSITEALVRLRAHAYSQGRLVSDVARDVVARQIRFDEIAP